MLNNKPKIHWITPEHNVVGNAFGYNSHNKSLKWHSEKYLDITPDSKIALQIVPADLFRPIPGKINILFTMWEFLELPNNYIKNIDRADAIIVPSRFCKEVFRKYTDKPIYVCFEGVDENDFKFHQRRIHNVSAGERFRFLWVGAPNARKGYPLILESLRVFQQIGDVEVYIKTTMPKTTWPQFIKTTWKKRREIFFENKKRVAWKRMMNRLPKPNLAGQVKTFGPKQNVFFDTRNLSKQELIALYNSAHCFLLPTFGEGWGLTLCEAMATGCPSIATAVTGCADFFDDDVGYSLKYEMHEQELLNYQCKATGYVPSVNDLVAKMIHVRTHYAEALGKGKKASARILTKFTWDKAAQRLRDIVADIEKRSAGQVGSGKLNEFRGVC